MKEKNKKGTLYAVYGTLKRNYGNNRLLQNNFSKFIGKTRTEKKFSLYDLGGFPAIKNNGNSEVEIEVFEVTDKQVEYNIDRLEGFYGKNYEHNLYNKETINTKYGKAFIYVYNGNILQNRFLPKGVWN